MREAVIVAAARTAVGKAPRGAFRTVHPTELAAAAIRAAVDRAVGLDPATIDDVIMGCAMPEAEQGLNLARLAAVRAGLPVSVPAQTVNRFCASGLQTIALAAQQIMCGMGDVIVAGGVESMSLVPMTGHHVAPNPVLIDLNPDLYLGMGLTAEHVARRYTVSREDQDAFALRSHLRALDAIDAGRFRREIVPLEVEEVWFADGARQQRVHLVAHDEGPRRDTSAGALARLRPVFAADGSVTAGNSSQTSDGAAAVVVMSAERAAALGVQPMAAFRSFAVAGVPPEIMGIGPIEAVPRALQRAGIRATDLDLIELNEAFAAQALAVIRALDLDEDRVNPDGGAIALGHPLGCTGARLTVHLVHELARRGGRYGLVTMCIGGGMGAAGVFERLGA
ncbi:MAG: acetyl-CoA C-acyltransferase [Chloroflexi bacterium]|nr:acetyl-CoA C-acyltransferase [Chloroflexota bacterium]